MRSGFQSSANGPWIEKDPAEVLDYQVDWDGVNSWLQGDTITSATWTVPAGLTQVSDSRTATTATVWLSGGVVGSRYTVSCAITTAGGRTGKRSFTVVVRQR